jgi:hypothetical protein
MQDDHHSHDNLGISALAAHWDARYNEQEG